MRSLTGIAVLSIVLGITGARLHSQQPVTTPAVTFTRDVAPVLFKNCISCHREGEMAPMSFTTYKDARPWARAIRQAVTTREMPPWGADPRVGEFSNDPHLSATDVELIARWVDGGAAEGNAVDLPALPVQVDGWQMGKPDLVLSMAAPFDIAAQPRSVYGDFPLPTNFSEDKYVRVTEVRPAARSVTHHANVFVKDASGNNRIASYSPGAEPKTYPPGVAKLIPKGAVLNLNMHYNPKGQPSRDPGTMVAFQFTDDPVRQIAITSDSSNNKIDIPPGAANYELEGKPFVFEQDCHILTLMPRMNERGKDFKYTLVYPDGRRVDLLSVPKWNYAWVFTYALQTPIAAPKGSRLETIAHWDNSAANKMNPDPALRVPFGPEIMNGYFEYTLDSQNLAERGRGNQ